MSSHAGITRRESERAHKSRTYLIKLVRDRVSKYFTSDSRFLFQAVPEEDFVKALRQKLIEECAEYVIDPSDNEMGDVLEVLMALAEHDLHVDWGHIIMTALNKRLDRGGFDGGVGMYQVDP